MNEMRAARLYKAGDPLIVESIPVPDVAADEVLVQVDACGLCGTDIHLAIDGDIPVQQSPITLGHEAAGVVARTGDSVTEYTVGDRVALFPSATCGRCRYCLAGRESLCESPKVYGMMRDGALAEFICASACSVVSIPESVPFEQAAIITDGVATPFHALRGRAQLAAGESVAVVGCGGLGIHAILLARMMGAGFIAAIDIRPDARERAVALGADLAVDPEGPVDARKSIERETGDGVDVALEFVGRKQSVNTAISVLGTGGRAVIVGVGMESPQLPPLVRFVGREYSIIGSFGMDKQDIEDLLVLVARERLDLGHSISDRYPLSKVNDALNDLATGAFGAARLVVNPGTASES